MFLLWVVRRTLEAGARLENLNSKPPSPNKPANQIWSAPQSQAAARDRVNVRTQGFEARRPENPEESSA